MSDPANGTQRTPEQWFAENLRQLRTQKGWSQSKLAEEVEKLGVGLHQQTVYKIETGNRQVRLNEASAIADCLKVTLESMRSPTGTDLFQGTLDEVSDARRKLWRSLTQFFESQIDLAFVLDHLRDVEHAPVDWEPGSSSFDDLGAEVAWAAANVRSRAVGLHHVPTRGRSKIRKKVRRGWRGGEYVEALYRKYPYLRPEEDARGQEVAVESSRSETSGTVNKYPTQE